MNASMKPYLAVVLALSLGLAACQAPDDPADASAEPRQEDDADALASKPREFMLPATVVPRSDAEENFGIDLTGLNQREADVVRSAWANYQRVLEGKKPDCPPTFGLSDGGSVMYDCGAYTLMRIKSLAGDREKPGYEYGPSLDLLNGHKAKRLRFVSGEEMQQLEADPPGTCPGLVRETEPDMQIHASDLDHASAVAAAEKLGEMVRQGHVDGDYHHGTLNQLRILEGHALLEQAMADRETLGAGSPEADESMAAFCAWLASDGFWYD